jgi:hypothetical protein
MSGKPIEDMTPDELDAYSRELDAQLVDFDEQDAAAERLREVKLKAARVEAQPAIESARSEYGEDGIAIFETHLGIVIVRRPKHHIYRRFLDAKSINTNATEQLVSACRVYPDRPTFDRVLEEAPHTLMLFADRIVDLCKRNAKEATKK